MPRPVSIACLLLAILLLLLLVLPGINWGLPSEERNRLTLGEDRTEWTAPKIPPAEAAEPWEAYPNFLRAGPSRTGTQFRSAFNPLRSYHPDEYVFFKSLSAMRPTRLKLFHGFFGWPALQFYVVGAALKGASWAGLAQVVPDMDFYFTNPQAMARLYLVGRVVTLLFGVGCLLAVWRAGTRLFGAAGGAAAALLLAATPLFGINARYLTADVPMLFWISMTLLASTHVLRGGGRKWFVLSGVFLGLAAATRYQGASAAFLIFSACLFREPVENAGDTGRTRLPARILRAITSRQLWLATIVAIAVFLVANPYIVRRWGQFQQEFLDELHASVSDQSALLNAALFAETGFGILLTATTAAALWMAAARRDREVWFVILGFGLPAALLLAGRPAMVRYLMPVSLLPALLVAWAFAAIHRRGVEIGKRMTKPAGPILLVVLLFVTLQQSFAFSALFSNPEHDTRTEAGKWIAQNIPAGAAIGVVSEPWQFELPPMNPKRFKIVVVAPMDTETLAKAAPDYFVCSDFQFPPLAMRGPASPAEEKFRRAVFDGEGGYGIAKRFAAWPFGQWQFVRDGPHDVRYADPVIVIAARWKGPPPATLKSPTISRKAKESFRACAASVE